jgi:hypothetical protein
LNVAADWIAQNPKTKISDDANGLDGFGEGETEVEIHRVQAQSTFVALVREPRRELHCDGRP